MGRFLSVILNNLNKVKIYTQALIIDDDPDLCMLLKAMLSKYIPDVRFVLSLEASKKLLVDIQPDIIFLDNNLPNGKGITFLIELKTLTPSAKLIMISAMAGLKKQALENGADVFIEKPLTEFNVKKALEGN
jgi:two-component system OmpR family response regulator